MKKRTKYITFMSLLAIVMIAAYFYMHNSAKNTSAASASLAPISKNVYGINVIVDPRMELLAALQTVSQYDEKLDLLTNESFTYKDDISKYFSKFSNHEAVKLFDKMSSSGFSYDAPPTAMLYLTQPLELKINKPFDTDLVNRVGQPSLEQFSQQIKNFARDTKFDEFYNKHTDLYKTMVDKNAEIIGNTNYIKILESYYGIKQNSYNIVLSPMFHRGGYGPRIKNDNGSYDVYSILGPSTVSDDIPVFGTESEFTYLAFHEFSHSFINPLTAQNLDEVNKYAKLFSPIYDKMVSQAYGNWETCVNEHIVRAVVARIADTYYSKEVYNKIISQEKKNGFLYVEALTKKLEEYEHNRSIYKTFDEFYPELIKTFKKLSEENMS